MYRPEHQRLASILKVLREKAGLTQRQLAAKLGKPQSVIAKIERGIQPIRFIEVLDWADATGADALGAMRDATHDTMHP